MAKPHIPDAMATAEPLEEPPGTRNPGPVGAGAAKGELYGLGLTQDDAAGPLEGLDEASLGADEVRHVHLGAGRHGHTVDGQQVLYRHRDPHQQAEIGARRQQPVKCACRGQGLVGSDELVGAEGRFQGLDTFQIRRGCRFRGDLAPA